MKQQYTFSRIISFLPVLLVAFLLVFSNYLFAQSPETLTGSGTWTVPCGVTSITVEVWGAGGGGGSSNAGDAAGGGGGGGYSTSVFTVTGGQTFDYSAGTGGAGGASGDNNPGAAGGDSNFGSVLAGGGQGGLGPITGGSAAPGLGGAGGTGDITGVAGATGGIDDGGNGGAGANGGGAGGIGDANAGNPGLTFGGGGAGSADKSGGTSYAGGNGANGGIIVTYTVDEYPTAPVITTSSQVLASCDQDLALVANTLTYGTGSWAVESGCGTFDDFTDPTTNITGLCEGTTVISWNSDGPGCPNQNAQISITTTDVPSDSDAGANLGGCSTSQVMSANTPTAGTGTWVLISGSGTPSDPNSPTATISGLSPGNNVWEWQVSNSPTCGIVNSDQISIFVDTDVTPSNAGSDQNVCYTSFGDGSTTVGANIPTIGTGVWTITGGGGGLTVADLTNPNTAVTGFGAGESITLTWTITDVACSGTSSSATSVTLTAILCNPDEPCTAVPIAVNSGTCSFTTYNNNGTTYSTGMADPACDEPTGGDIWFSTIVPPTGQVQIDFADPGGIEPILTVYDGPCTALEINGCIDDLSASDQGPLTYMGAPGSTIYIRINPADPFNPQGSFDLCVYEATTATVSEVLPGVTTTISCGQTLNFYDTGGAGGTTSTNTSQPPPAGNYTNNTGGMWEICPDDPTQYVQVTFNEFTMETGFDKLIIMSADTVIAQWTGNEGQGDVVTSINPGECLQFIMQSDYIWTAEGWEALVECTSTPVPAQISNACEIRNCNGGCGIWVCLDGTYDTEAGAGSGVDEVNEVTGGCWGAAGEVATSWFYFTIEDAGDLSFEFVPSNSGHNINFALYGPSDDGEPPCPLSTGDAPIRCSFAGAGGINTGLATGETDLYDNLYGNGMAAPLAVTPGQTFALVVDVYQNGKPPTETTINFTGVDLDCTVLPIELIDFSGVNNGDHNVLSWITSTERNNDYFTVFRSVDGYFWEEVGTIEGAGNSSRPLFYTLNDSDPHFPITYYRLKQTDFDGEYKWSETISISTIKKSEDEFISDLFPNPSATYASFAYTGHNTVDPLNVQVVNMFGEVVVNLDYTKVTKNMPATIVTGQLAEGLYQVTFRQGKKVETKRLAVIRE